jgi:hypothetical protein
MAGAEDRHDLRLTGEAGQGVRRKVAPSIRHQDVQFGRQSSGGRRVSHAARTSGAVTVGPASKRGGPRQWRVHLSVRTSTAIQRRAPGAGRRGGRVVQGLTLLLPAGIVLAPWRAHLLARDPWRAPRRGGGPRGGGAAAPVGRGAPCGTQVAPHAVVVPALRALGTARVGHGARPAGPSPGYGPAGVAPGRRSPPPALPPAQAAAPEAPSRQPHTPAWRP